MAKKEETGRVVMSRVALPPHHAQRTWAPVRDLRERLGCAGCTVGILGVVFSGFSAYWVAALLRDALSSGFAQSGGTYFWVLFPFLLSVVGFTICWRHPSLARIVLAVMLAVAGVFTMWVVLIHALYGSG